MTLKERDPTSHTTREVASFAVHHNQMRGLPVTIVNIPARVVVEPDGEHVELISAQTAWRLDELNDAVLERISQTPELRGYVIDFATGQILP